MKEKAARPNPKDDLPLDVFDLDILRLDKHFLEQPKLVIDYGLKLADARDGMDRAKASLDIARAEAESEITANPEEFGLSKTTVNAISSAVNLHESVLAATERFNRRKHEVSVLQAMMEALEHRKRSLEALVQLHGQQYYATPQVDLAGRKALEEQTKASVRRLGRS